MHYIGKVTRKLEQFYRAEGVAAAGGVGYCRGNRAILLIDADDNMTYNRGMARKQSKTYSVTELTTLIGVALEGGLPSRLTVVGEISGFKRHSSGHCYFSLKDAGAVVNCVMWKSKSASVKFTPADGMAVFAVGHIDVYSPGGKYQLYVDRLTPAGLGQLQIAFEQMVKRLRAEGLFDDEHKKTIPSYPMRIGIMTSQSGAAMMDIIDSIYNRWPCAKLLLYPVPVQGSGAAEKIAEAIDDVNRRNRAIGLDVLIVGRGGGSLEDLWAFNEEVLARAIFRSEIPVISAVGHEEDVTIADLVADARASTPTRAGVIAVPDVSEIMAGLVQSQRRIEVNVESRLRLCRQGLRTSLASAVFRNPRAVLNAPTQGLDELQSRMAESLRERFYGFDRRLMRAHERIQSIEPSRLLAVKVLEVTEQTGRIRQTARQVLGKKRLQLTAVENRLGALNPRSVLARGYSITVNERTGRLVGGCEDVQVGDMITTELARGEKIGSKVVEKVVKVEKNASRGKK